MWGFEKIRLSCKSINLTISATGIKASTTIQVQKVDDGIEHAFDVIKGRLAAKPEHGVDVLCLTANNMDRVIRIDRIEPDHESIILAGPFLCPGGSGANTAAILAAAGINVAVAGVVGSDATGRQLVASMTAFGADTNLMVTAPGKSGQTDILVSNSGQRLIVVHPSINDDLSDALNFDSIMEAARTCKILHLSSFSKPDEYDFQVRLAEAVANETVISLTPGAIYSGRGADGLNKLLKNVSILFLYKEQLCDLVRKCSPKKANEDDTESLAASYFSWKFDKCGIERPQILFIKERLVNHNGYLTERFISVAAGTNSLRYFLSAGNGESRGFPIVDTTGAGDAAAAGALRALLQNETPEQCATDASGFAGFFSTGFGARGALSQAPRSGKVMLPIAGSRLRQHR